ncbi:hypothetical protein [uncultured Sulfitobacter sp.]|uniref:hypothetical protein n=1 Tax=uncultured Sulfitobacter sp. TaxID=191468 RepID=UPI002605602B|nr:hypothetical protein [uncultured Sulfitobacter sp.]
MAVVFDLSMERNCDICGKACIVFGQRNVCSQAFTIGLFKTRSSKEGVTCFSLNSCAVIAACAVEISSFLMSAGISSRTGIGFATNSPAQLQPIAHFLKCCDILITNLDVQIQTKISQIPSG